MPISPLFYVTLCECVKGKHTKFFIYSNVAGNNVGPELAIMCYDIGGGRNSFCLACIKCEY